MLWYYLLAISVNEIVDSAGVLARPRSATGAIFANLIARYFLIPNQTLLTKLKTRHIINLIKLVILP